MFGPCHSFMKVCLYLWRGEIRFSHLDIMSVSIIMESEAKDIQSFE